MSFDELEDTIVSLKPARLKNCILLGDFNVDLCTNNQLSKDLHETLSTFHFTQVVNEPTRIIKNSSTLVDHIYVSSASLLSSCVTLPPLGSSDHRHLSLNWSKCPQKTVSRRIWNYSCADWDVIVLTWTYFPSCRITLIPLGLTGGTTSSNALLTISPQSSVEQGNRFPGYLFKLLRKRNSAFAKLNAKHSLR